MFGNFWVGKSTRKIVMYFVDASTLECPHITNMQYKQCFWYDVLDLERPSKTDKCLKIITLSMILLGV